MNIKQNLAQWKLLEMIYMGNDPTDMEGGAPLQWLKFSGTQPQAQGSIVILAGFNGPARNDSRVLQLLQKALSTGILSTVSDLYLCPITNPTSLSRAPHLNERGNDILNDFPTQKDKSASDIGQSQEVTTLLRWIEKVQPKAILSLTADKPYLNHFLTPQDILDKLVTLSERPILALGDKPAKTEEEEKNAIAPSQDEEAVVHNFDKNLGQWCIEKEIIWLNFSVDSGLKNFEEVREDWRLNTGPALKWLLEGPRFNPPVEEPFFNTPTVIPTVELPPELMNL